MRRAGARVVGARDAAQLEGCSLVGFYTEGVWARGTHLVHVPAFRLSHHHSACQKYPFVF